MLNKFHRSLEISRALFNNIEKSAPRCRHFSFVYYQNKLISIGQNNKKTHPINLKNPVFSENGQNLSEIKGCCSEMIALLKVKRKTNLAFNKCELYNIRIDKNGVVCNSYPCKSCQNLILFLGIKKVYYTDNCGSIKQYEKS